MFQWFKSIFLITTYLVCMLSCNVKIEEISDLINPKLDFVKFECNGAVSYEMWDLCEGDSFSFDNYELPILHYNELGYVQNIEKISTSEFSDDLSIPLYKFNGELFNHPKLTASYGLEVINVYRTTGNNDYLTLLEAICNKILDHSIIVDSARFFPYPFDLDIHFCKEEKTVAPWYSALAQGTTLSLFTRMFIVTNDSSYLDECDKIFNSFARYKGQGIEPWISCIDSKGNLWLEEYPEEYPNHTLNGMIWAIYGLYDYYRITQKKDVGNFIKASIATIEKNIEKYRNPSGVSFYCLKHMFIENKHEEYHQQHKDQLYYLYKLSGSKYLAQMAIQFDLDANYSDHTIISYFNAVQLEEIMEGHSF